jgi:hypothetical protein
MIGYKGNVILVNGTINGSTTRTAFDFSSMACNFAGAHTKSNQRL